jgi:hypothetical protein
MILKSRLNLKRQFYLQRYTLPGCPLRCNVLELFLPLSPIFGWDNSSHYFTSVQTCVPPYMVRNSSSALVQFVFIVSLSSSLALRLYLSNTLTSTYRPVLINLVLAYDKNINILIHSCIRTVGRWVLIFSF